MFPLLTCLDYKLILGFLCKEFTPSFVFGAAGISTISALSGLHLYLTNQITNGKKQCMKAVAISSYNGIVSIEMRRDLPIPKITEKDEVLIKVIAAGFNDIDLKIARGYGREIRKCNPSTEELTIILGRECSGIIVDAGVETPFCKGDEVWVVSAYCMEGLMSEYVVVKENQVTLKPKNLTFEEAASLPYTAVQVWNALSNRLSSTTVEGKRVLIHAGNSPVGLFAMQLLKAWKADVTTTVPTAGLPMCHELGVDDVIVYTVTDFEMELRKRQRFDIVLNTVGSLLHQLCVEVCRPGAQIITFVRSPLLSDRFGILGGSLLAFSLQIAAWIQKIKRSAFHFTWDNLSYSEEYLKKTRSLIQDKQIFPIVEKVFEMEDALIGFQELGKFQNVGKMVLRISSPSYKIVTRHH